MDLRDTNGAGPLRRWLRRFEARTYGFAHGSRRRSYGYSLVVSSLFVLIQIRFDHLFAPTSFVVPMAAVFLSVWFLGLGASVIAATVMALAHIYFFEQPFLQLSLTKVGHQNNSGVISFIGVSLLINGLVSLLRYSRAQTNQRLEQANLALEQRVAERTAELEQDMAERKLAEDQLKREKEFSQDLIESSVEGIVALDHKLRYTVWNPAMEKMTGLKASEVIGKVSYEAFPFLQQEGITKRFVRPALAGRATKTGVMEFRIPETGKRGYFEENFAPIRAVNGEIIGVLGIVRDVTSHRLAEQAIKESEERLRVLTETANDGIISTTETGQIIYFNAAAERIFGYTKDKVMGEGLNILMPERYFKTEGDGILERFIPSHEARIIGNAIELYGRNQTGTEFPIELSMAKWQADNKQFFFTFIVRDITDRKQSEQSFRTLVEGVPDYAIFLLTPAGNVASWNLGAERIHKYKSPEIIGQHFSKFWLPEDVAAGKPQQALEMATRDGKYESESWRLRQDGTRFFASVSITALKDPSGNLEGFSKIIRDITERNRVDQMKSDFVSLVSHQLKTPVALVRGYVDNLLTGLAGSLTDKQRSYLEDIQEISAKNYNLITDLLNISRLERGVISLDVRRVKLRDVMHLALRSNRQRIAARGVDLIERYSDADQEIMADKFKMAEAINNVVDNAIKFTDRGSITIQSRVRGGKLQLEISDTGQGMSADMIDKMFTRDQVLSGSPRAEDSSGLGLYIANQFMTMQSGKIEASSKLGQGSKFTFSIPAAKVESKQVIK